MRTKNITKAQTHLFRPVYQELQYNMFFIIYSCSTDVHFTGWLVQIHGYEFKFLPNTKLAQIYFPFSNQYPQTFCPITLPAFSPLPSEFPFHKKHYFLMVFHPFLPWKMSAWIFSKDRLRAWERCGAETWIFQILFPSALGSEFSL